MKVERPTSNIQRSAERWALGFERFGVAQLQPAHQPLRMGHSIYPRSPRETMGGWIHLPRYIDKIRLHLAGQLHPDYQPNLGKGFDELWLKHAGLTHEQMVDVVKPSLTDGQVCDWVRTHAPKTAAEKEAHRQAMLNYPSPDDAAGLERLNTRKQQSGLGQRDDIRCFVDYIDADEKRM